MYVSTQAPLAEKKLRAGFFLRPNVFILRSSNFTYPKTF